MISMPIELYTDGSSLKNPGVSGLGYIIRYWDTPEGAEVPNVSEIEFKQGYRMSTNNRMEIMAALFGLRAIIEKIKDRTFYGTTQINLMSDSKYLVDAINQGWVRKWLNNNWMTSGFQGKKPTPVKNKDLWEQFIDVQNQIHDLGINLTLSHVDGHADNEFNNRADKLATDASNNSTEYMIDEVYEALAKSLNKRRW